MERFHRQLKAAIICHESANWVDSLPLVLLGIRSAFKEDLQTTSAELLYGEPLRLPGEFFNTEPDFGGTPVLTEFASKLRGIVQNLKPTPASRHSNQKKTTFVFKDLATCSHVFLRDCTVGRTNRGSTVTESVVRKGTATLLSGDRVPIIKTDEERSLSKADSGESCP